MSNNQLEDPSVYLERLNQYLRATSAPSMDEKSKKTLSPKPDEDQLKMSTIKYMRRKVHDEAKKNKWIIAQEEHSSVKVDQASSMVKNWLPQDDGIHVTLPLPSSEAQAPTREDMNSYIEAGVFDSNGSTRKKRLQVFTEICSDREDDGSASKSS